MKLVVAVWLGVAATVGFPAVAFADDCPVKDFTIMDAQTMHASDITKLVTYSILDKATSDKSSQSGSAEFVVYDVPIKLSASQAEDWSQHVLQQSGYNLDSEQRLATAQSVLSPVAAGMYADCVGANHFKVQPLASTAITDPTFTINLKWLPGISSLIPHPLHVTVTNGKVVGETPLTHALMVNGVATIKILKQGKPGEATTVAIAIGSDTFPTIEVPIYNPPKKYSTRWVTGIASVKSELPSWNRCDTSAELGSGPHKDNHEHSCTLCVHAENGVYLFPQTAELSGTVVGGVKKIDDGADTTHVCALFDVSASNDTGESNYISAGSLKVLEAVPQ